MSEIVLPYWVTAFFPIWMIVTASVGVAAGSVAAYADRLKELDAPYFKLLARGLADEVQENRPLGSSKLKQIGTSANDATPVNSFLVQVNMMEQYIQVSEVLPREVKSVATDLTKSLLSIESRKHSDLSVEQDHILQTIAFTHLPETLKLFESLGGSRFKKNKQTASVLEQLKNLKAAVGSVDDSIIKDAEKKLETNRLYLASKFNPGRLSLTSTTKSN
jgi:hypothetical protein